MSTISSFFCNLTKPIAIIANGRDRISTELLLAINQKAIQIIAVDGGLNLCIENDIHPNFLVGDLDSIDRNFLNSLQGVQIIQLDRAKDIVDLEEGIQIAMKIDNMATPCIFNSLGGRRDHHLSNLYLLLKYPQAIIFSNNSMISSKKNQLKINEEGLKESLFAFYGEVRLSSGQELIRGEITDLNKEELSNFLEGEGLSIFHEKEEVNEITLRDITFPYSSESEDIFLISTAETFSLETIPGLTISLIPWLGPVSGIKTQGLKWELGEETIDKLDKDFVGISNIAMSNSVSITVNEGQLLCVVEKKIIDKEMIDLIPV